MAPTTIPNNLNSDRDNRSLRSGEKRSELVCRVKFCNTLPDIPFDPKFITYPFESIRFIQYNPTSLERNYKYEVLTEHDLGVNIDLINRDTYAGDPNTAMDPADEKLLEEDILTPQDSKRSRHHARSVSWLRRTEYISTEQTRFQPQTMDKVEAKVGYSIKKNFKDETLYMDRDSQIKAIEKTFEDSRKPIERHYSKPNVVPEIIRPVYPDFKIWKYPCAQVIFDSDPAPTGRTVPAQIEEMSQAMLRGVMDESGEQFVAYFLPTPETLEKRRRDVANNIDYEDDEEYEYKMAREYNWNVKSKASKGYEENYFLVIRDDGVYYNELETRVRLSKRRQKIGQTPNNTRLVVKHRPLKAQEFRMQRYRERQLEAPREEEEDDEDDDEIDDVAEERQPNGSTVGNGPVQIDDEAEQDDTGNKNRSRSSSVSGSEKMSNRGDSDKEGSGKEESDKEDSDKGESDKADEKEGSEKGGSDRETSEREGSDREGSEKADSEREGSDREGSGSDQEDEKEINERTEKGNVIEQDAERGKSESEGGSASSASSTSGSKSGSGSGSSSDSSSGSDNDSES